MTDFAQVRRATFEIEGPRDGSLEARAMLVFKILAVAAAAGVVLALFPPITPVSTLLTVAFNAAAAVLAAAYWRTAKGLERKEPWAVAIVRPMLALVAIFGAYVALAAIGEGTLRIPFEVALAGWAILGPADVRPLPRPDRRAFALLAAVAALLAVLAFGHRVFGWGGALDVDESDLQASIAVTCGDPAANLPPRIAVAYDWSWQRSSPIPSGVDMVIIGWSGTDTEGRPLYIFGGVPEHAPGIQPGREGYPSAEMGRAVAAESEANYRWAIDLGRQQLAPGRIDLDLRFARETVPESGTLALTATYVHLGQWRQSTAATCTW